MDWKNTLPLSAEHLLTDSWVTAEHNLG